MATIGAISVDLIRGTRDLGGEAVESMVRRGRNYPRFREIGQRTRPVEIQTTEFCATLNDATTHESACMALKGTAVTVTDALGIATTNCMILDVQVLAIRKCYLLGALKYRVDVAWGVQAGVQ